jgi:hypothetical protein
MEDVIANIAIPTMNILLLPSQSPITPNTRIVEASEIKYTLTIQLTSAKPTLNSSAKMGNATVMDEVVNGDMKDAMVVASKTP